MSSNSISGTDFLISAITQVNPFLETKHFQEWFTRRREVHKFSIEEIAFKDMGLWGREPSTGNLVHNSGRFFKIEGIWVETNFGHRSQWSQPIINQAEIGILGFITKRFDGILYFLTQVKMEPGNINMVQLAPTLQATRSNFTRVHKGRTPPYLEYFLHREKHQTLVDVLQSEQGARFLRKRNRNIIIEVTDDIKVLDDYCWLTLGQLRQFLLLDNVVNMDARTVLSCINLANSELQGQSVPQVLNQLSHSSSSTARPDTTSDFDPFRLQVLASSLEVSPRLFSNADIISWFTELKFKYELNVEPIPLKYVQDWVCTDREIHHRDDKFFSVIAVRVEADNREVPAWTQPLVKPKQEGVVAFLVKEINGVLHFLVQGKVEPGNFDVVEMAPTVQCLTGSYRDVQAKDQPAFLDYVLKAKPEQIRYRGMQSEEGGRFYREQNLNLIIETDSNFPIEIPSNFIWMTLSQLKDFIHYNNFVNVQARCLVSCLGLI